MVRNTICTSKVMIPVFRGGGELISVDTLDPNETFTQDLFISFLSSRLKKRAQNLSRRKHPIEVAAHMDNSGCHRGRRSLTK
jgi:hypothetical protein